MAARATVVVAAALVVAACAGRRIENGVYRAPSGYRVTLPGEAWAVIEESRADLELRHRTAPAAMLVNGLCDAPAVHRRPDILVRQLLFGLRDRVVVESGETPVNGRVASHTLVEGRMRQTEERMRIESYVVKGERCVYDLLYVAPPEVFDAARADFHRLVESFVTD